VVPITFRRRRTTDADRGADPDADSEGNPYT